MCTNLMFFLHMLNWTWTELNWTIFMLICKKIYNRLSNWLLGNILCFMLQKLLTFYSILFYSTIPWHSCERLVRLHHIACFCFLKQTFLPQLKLALVTYRPRYLLAAGEALRARMHIGTEHFRNSALKRNSILFTQISNSWVNMTFTSANDDLVFGRNRALTHSTVRRLRAKRRPQTQDKKRKRKKTGAHLSLSV